MAEKLYVDLTTVSDDELAELLISSSGSVDDPRARDIAVEVARRLVAGFGQARTGRKDGNPFHPIVGGRYADLLLLATAAV